MGKDYAQLKEVYSLGCDVITPMLVRGIQSSFFSQSNNTATFFLCL